MASSSLFIILASVLLGLCSADLIDDACRAVGNPRACVAAVRSDPTAATADKWTVGLIAANKGIAAIQALQNVAGSLNGEVAKTCVEVAGDSIDNLKDVVPILAAKSTDLSKIATARTRASAALTDIDTCSDEYGGKLPPQLKSRSDTATDLIRALLAIANTL